MTSLFAFLLTFAIGMQSAPVLERVATELPRAGEGHWSAWDATQAPQDELRELFVPSVEAYRRGDLIGALTATWQLLEAYPDYPPSLHQLGVVYFRLRRYGDAITAFERLLDHAPGEIGETRALGHCYYSLGRYDDAGAHYEKVLAVEPQMVEAQRGYGLVQLRLGRTERALEILTEVVAARPRDAGTHAWIAQLHYDLDQLDEAEAAAQRAIDADPFEPKPWFLLAKLHFDAGRDDEGERCRARFSELDRSAQTIRALEAELLLDPSDTARLAALAKAFQASGDGARCRRTIARLVQAEPDTCAWRVVAFECLAALGDQDGRAWALRELETRCGENVETWEFLEQYYARTQDRIKQVEAGERLRRLRSK